MSDNPPGKPGAPRGAGWESLGKHWLRVEDDVLHAICHGGFNLEEMKRIVEECRLIGERYGYVMVYIDGTHAAWSTPEARKYQASSMSERVLPNHTVVLGANIMIRATVGLVHRAVHLLTGKVLNASFVDTEEAARAVLSRARQQFVAQGITRPPRRDGSA